MSEVAEDPVNTFSIGFTEDSYDELEFARAVANRHETNHHEYTVTPDSMAVLPELIEHYEMPFGDPSAIPTYYVSQIAAEEITVALSGDAGDENFAGYDRYRFDRIADRLNRIPRPLRKVGRRVADGVGEVTDNSTFDRAARALTIADGDEVERYLGFIYFGGRGPGDHPEQRVWSRPEADDEFRYLREAFDRADGPTRLDRLMQVDLETYLPDDILVKVDRASMAHSLEVRSPLLDHEVAEFAASVPAKYKYHRGESKWLLKRATQDLLPDIVVDRSKQGFGVPISEWFRGELRGFCRNKLDRLGERDPFDASTLNATFETHVDNNSDNGGDLWNWVMLESWWERYID
jgi:asparagine synthase (glutamine-hydrolysing)